MVSEYFIAADNILVTDGPTGLIIIKLADFNLFQRFYHFVWILTFKNIFSKDWNNKEGEKWGNTTKKSDVYSFGVVLWQIFSYWEEPKIEAKDLPCPPACTNEVWSLMKDCWKVSPSDRPDATGIVSQLRRIQNQMK